MIETVPGILVYYEVLKWLVIGFIWVIVIPWVLGDIAGWVFNQVLNIADKYGDKPETYKRLNLVKIRAPKLNVAVFTFFLIFHAIFGTLWIIKQIIEYKKGL